LIGSLSALEIGVTDATEEEDYELVRTYTHTHTHTHTHRSHQSIPLSQQVAPLIYPINVVYSFYSFFSPVQADRIDGQITQTKAELSRLLDILCLTAEEVMEVREDDAGVEVEDS
jgi:hypothetical protein